jgi:putative ABC transport system permease protein
MLRVRPGIDTSVTSAHVREVLRLRHGIRPDEPDDFMIRSQTELVSSLSAIGRLATNIVLVLLSPSLVVSALGVLNSVLAGVIERTCEIGLRRAVGATRQTIRIQFVAESAVIGGGGAALGLLIALALSPVVLTALQMPLYIDSRVAALAVGAALALAVVAGVWPAVRAASLNPVDALRHE